MSEKKDLTLKIKETKRQTDELKSQIQNLIDNGKKQICPHSKHDLISNNDDKEPLESPNKVQIIKSYDKQYAVHETNHSGNIPTEKTEVQPFSLKKSKPYDVKEAREFMKKQKEQKRLEQKQTLTQEKIKAEIQKKKLEELNRKSRELLAKNVQAKRERSKSREKSDFVRPDETNFGSNLRKAVSSDRLDMAAAVRQRNPNLLYPSEPYFCQRATQSTSPLKNAAQREVPGKIKIISRNFTRQTADDKNVPSTKVALNVSNQNIKPNILNIPKSKTPGVNDIRDGNEEGVNLPKEDQSTKGKTLQKLDNIVKKNTTKINQKQEEHVSKKDEIDTNKQKQPGTHTNIAKKLNLEGLEPKILFTSGEEREKSPVESVRNILEYKSKSKSNISLKTPDTEVNEKIGQTKQPDASQTLPNVPPTQKPPDQIEKCSVEIQTDIANKEYPKWLDEQPQAYPFNFINTVKRKLQFATMQKPTADVGIQSSFLESAKKSDLNDSKPFLSHKCLNLDPKTIEHLELVPKRSCNSISRKLRTETESESDTSKNIPEISSESGTSLKKNAESVQKALMLDNNLIINTEKIDSMKLVPHEITNTIRTETRTPYENKSEHSKPIGNTLTVDKYGSDFDSDMDVSTESLDRSRRSIISFNKSGYNQVLIPSFESSKSPDASQKAMKTASTVTSEMIQSNNTNPSSKSINSEMIQSNNTNPSSKFINSEMIQSNYTNPSSKFINSEMIQSNNTNRSSKSVRESRGTECSMEKFDGGVESKVSKSESSTEPKKTEKKPVTSSKNSSVRTMTSLSKSDSSWQNINTKRGSGNSKDFEKVDFPSLVEPAVSLVASKGESGRRSSVTKFRNISVRSSKVSTQGSTNDANQIHLKFEAEIHLLNDFNESLRKFSALEQAVETLKTKNTITTSKILQNTDVRTTKTSSEVSENVVPSRDTQSQNSQINYSRGSFINTSLDDLNEFSTALDLDHTASIVSTGLEITNLQSVNQSLSIKSGDYPSNFDKLQSVNVAGISLNMFEQLIKDEDARLENLKTILKIRERALLDRTKGELAWLEIQRKHFKETGRLHEASVIKKKQRGILVNHQKEKHEMQRLKQMQNAASIERKIVLKEQRNLIRQQLSTDNMLTKMKVNTPREKRHSGPLRVLQSHTESIRSETSVSRRSSSERDKDVISITSHHSLVSEISEVELPSKDYPSGEQQKYIKKTLLMREAALKKRREAAEELLQWHTKLLEEEKRIAILESTASAIISQKPNAPTTDQFDFKGKQLNQLWLNLTGSEAKKFIDDKVYPMSQMALERFCKSAREYADKTKNLLRKTDDDENVPTQKTDYASDFDNEDTVDRSIDILIDNFNKIQDDISTLSIAQSKKSDDSRSDEILSDRFESDAEISVIETNREKSKSLASIVLSKHSEVEPIIEDKMTIMESEVADEIPEEVTRTKIGTEGNLASKSESTDGKSIPLKESIGGESEKSKIDAVPALVDSEPEKSSILVEEEVHRKEFEREVPVEGSEPSKIATEEEGISTEEKGTMDDPLPTIASDSSSNFMEESRDRAKEEGEEVIEEDWPSSKPTSIEEKRDSAEEEEREDTGEKSPSSKPTSIEENEVRAEEEPEDTGEKLPSSKATSIAESKSRAGEEIEDTGEKLLSSKATSAEENKGRAEEEIEDTGEKLHSSKATSIEESKDLALEELPEDTGEESPPITAETKESLNASQEILQILGGSEIKTSSDEEIPEKEMKESLNASEEILSKLHRLSIEEEDKTEEDLCSQSFLRLYQISKSDESKISELQDVPSPENSNKDEDVEQEIGEFEFPDDLVETNVDEDNQSIAEEKVEAEEEIKSRITAEGKIDSEETKSNATFRIDRTNENQNFLNNLVASATEIDIVESHEESDESKRTLSDKSNDSFVIHDDSQEKLDEKETPGGMTEDISVTEDVEEEKTESRLSYGVLERTEDKETTESDVAPSKEEANSFEEKEHDSLSSANGGSSSEALNLEEQSINSSENKNSADSSSAVSKVDSKDEVSAKDVAVDVKKRVSEIMADTNVSRGDKSPRLQDLYVTTYDLISPANSPEKNSSSPVEDTKSASSIFDSEAEEILRKQLAVEEEIKAITEQQQKERQLPLVYVREIPNKPPPPYTPPTAPTPAPVPTIIPTSEEIEEITMYSAKILHKAYLSNNLENVTISNNTLSLISKDISKDRYKFVFDLCRDIARDHYKKFEEDKTPSWLRVSKKPEIAPVKPLDPENLKIHMIERLKEIFGYRKSSKRENAIIKWSRKKRDHVDEILVMECQQEEARWTDYRKDEMLVKDRVTDEILDDLLKDAAKVLLKMFSKKS